MGHGSRTQLVTAGVLVAVFGAGALLGFAVDMNLGAEQPSEVVSGEPVEPGDEAPRRRARVYDQVEPTEEQDLLIDSIVAEYRARTIELDDELRAKYDEQFQGELRGELMVILLETRKRIKRVLTPEQATEYQRLLDELDARSAAERENGDGGGD